LFDLAQTPNGLRYPRVGGTRQRHFDETSFKPRKLPENAATPTRRVHAVLAGFLFSQTRFPLCTFNTGLFWFSEGHEQQ
jgi:hypothetical protein